MSAERMPFKCAMRSSSAGHCGARACNYPFCVEIPRGVPKELSHRQMFSVRKCPCCGAMGFRSVRWIGPQLIGHCRHGHPYILEQSP